MLDKMANSTHHSNPPDIENALKLTKGTPAQRDAGIIYLCNKMTPMIHKLMHSICPTCNPEDMLQAGRYGVILAIESYKDGKNKFTSWCYSKIRNELQQQRCIEFPVAISRYMLKKGATASFSQVNDNMIYETSPCDNLMDKDSGNEIAEALRYIQKTYPKLHCRLFVDYYYLDQSLADLSRQYKLNANAVVRAMILDIRAHIKKRG